MRRIVRTTKLSIGREGLLRAHGASQSVIEQAVAAKTRIWDYYRSVANGKDGDAATSHATRDAIIKSLREFQRYRPEIPSGVMDPSTEDVREFRAFAQMIYYDPAPDFKALRVPLLELLGMNDEVVDPKTTIAALERLRSTGHDVTIRTFAGVGHSLVVMDGTRPVGNPAATWSSLRNGPVSMLNSSFWRDSNGATTQST